LTRLTRRGNDDNEEEEEEEIEVKEKTIEKEVFLGALEVVARQARKVGKRWRTTIEVQFLLDAKLEEAACESSQAR
jgi:heat shock protein 1/8